MKQEMSYSKRGWYAREMKAKFEATTTRSPVYATAV